MNVNTLQRGDVVDRYRLDERLGAGAFGEVWKAQQLADGREVGLTCAVKLMRLSKDRTDTSAHAFASSWLEEVRNLVKVAGETIPRIFDANVWQGHAYIAMELLVGTTLATRLQRGAVPWRRALFIADQIAQALEAAHQVKIVHRDLKPQNVIVAGPQRVCVIDWGIASLNASTVTPTIDVERREGDGELGTEVGDVAPITTPRQRAAPVGTPGYVAPEVYDGVPARNEQDVFALGVCLYEMLSGRLPHAVERLDRTTSDSVKAYRSSLDKATQDYSLVPLRDIVPGLPDEVYRLVDALLARDPAARPRELRGAIQRAIRFPYGVPDPPYAGLVSLGPERAGLYFGQQDTISHVLDRLRTQRAALLWGPSGSGKSSLALAGVAATMDRELFADTDGWQIHVVRPRDSQALVAATGEGAGSTLGHVIVIDQLEEVVDLEAGEQKRFCDVLLGVLDRKSGVAVRDKTIGVGEEVRVVATIRDDLEWRVDREVPALRPLLERRIIVKGVDANFARNIIEEPARALGYSVEGIDAVSREVEERLSADGAKLPVVQYALSEWWQRRDTDKKVLPAAAWKELGGVDGALSFVAEKFFAALDAADQDRVKTLFTQLFQGGRKRPVAESKLEARTVELAQELTKLRLVGRRVKKDSAPFFEVEHESLATNWSRLAGWLAEAREDQAMAEELEGDAAAYARDHDVERLWKKGRLAAAVDMAARGRITLTPAATEFLQVAKQRARRGRVVTTTVAAIALVLVLGLVYALVLNAAASKERDQAVVELQTARDKAKQEIDSASARAKQVEADAATKAKALEAEAKEAEERARKAQEEVAKAASDNAKAQEDLKKLSAEADKKLKILKATCGTGFSPGGF